jgi:hypothetical protein
MTDATTDTAVLRDAQAAADLSTPYGNAVHQLRQVARTMAACITEHRDVLNPAIVANTIGPELQAAMDRLEDAELRKATRALPYAERPGPKARAAWMADHVFTTGQMVPNKPVGTAPQKPAQVADADVTTALAEKQ